MPPPPRRHSSTYEPSRRGSVLSSGLVMLIAGRTTSLRTGATGYPPASGATSVRRRPGRRRARLGGAGGVPGRPDGRAAAGNPAEDLVDVGAVHRLPLDQQLGEAGERVAVAGEQVGGARVGGAQ